MNEEMIESTINRSAIMTLSMLKSVFVENNLSDTEATLSLMLFIKVFIENGWKGEKVTNVLNNIMEVVGSFEKQLTPQTNTHQFLYLSDWVLSEIYEHPEHDVKRLNF